jgi:uncharacterized membrane protein YphA (DoxX/SURF4 family)
MQEFFEVWGMHALNDFTLAFSVVMIAFEIVAGIAVLIGWRFRIFSWLLLLLILFFTFLTGYAVLSGKIKECGCFGNCIPLTAMMSFVKDLILLALIVFLFINRNKVRPAAGAEVNIALLSLATIASFMMQFSVLKHLPIVDCLPYKEGNNIIQKMKVPAGAVPDSTVITFVYNKDGKEVEFTSDKFPADFSEQYTFVRRYDKLIRKGNAEPAIKDFSLTDSSGVNVTQVYFADPRPKVLVFVKDIPADFLKHADVFRQLYNSTANAGRPFDIVTPVLDEAKAAFNGVLPGKPINYYTCDLVAVKTAARSPITIFTIDGATIINKYSYKDAWKMSGAKP